MRNNSRSIEEFRRVKNKIVTELFQLFNEGKNPTEVVKITGCSKNQAYYQWRKYHGKVAPSDYGEVKKRSGSYNSVKVRSQTTEYFRMIKKTFNASTTPTSFESIPNIELWLERLNKALPKINEIENAKRKTKKY